MTGDKDNHTLVAEELAVIIPVHENAVDDATVAVLTKPAKTVPPKATKGKGDDKWKPYKW